MSNIYESTESRRDKLESEIKLMEAAMNGGAITKAQYIDACSFINGELSKLNSEEKTATLGFDEVYRAIQSQSIDEIKRTIGIDVPSFMSRYGSFVSSPAMRVGDVAIYSNRENWGGKYAYLRNIDANEYQKQVTGQWSDVGPGPLNDPAVYASESVSISYLDFTNSLTEDEAGLFLEEIKKSMDQETMGIFKSDTSASSFGRYGPSPFREFIGQYGSGAAEMIWKEYGGIVLCECDNSDCDAQIDITHDEYIHASGNGGYYRVTSQDCNYGVLGAYLVERGKNYRVWTKMA